MQQADRYRKQKPHHGVAQVSYERKILAALRDRQGKNFFRMCVHVDDERCKGTGPTKQKAKYHAAKAAMQKAFHANLPEETGISDHDPVENLACLSAGLNSPRATGVLFNRLGQKV